MYKAYDVGNIQLYHLCVQSNNSKATIICICLLNKIVSKQTMPSTTQYESMINHHSAHDSHSGVQELIRCPLRHLSPKILFMLPFRQRKVWRDRFPEISRNHAFNTIFLWCTYPRPNKISYEPLIWNSNAMLNLIPIMYRNASNLCSMTAISQRWNGPTGQMCHKDRWIKIFSLIVRVSASKKPFKLMAFKWYQ